MSRSLGANLLARDVPIGAITFEPSSPPESLGFAVSATATPEPELGASAAEKLRRAVAALEAFEDQRKADARLSAEEGDTEVSAPKLELVAASRADAPVTSEDADDAYRLKEPSDEELTVVRPNPLVAQERAAYRDSQVDIALPEAATDPAPSPPSAQPLPSAATPPPAETASAPAPPAAPTPPAARQRLRSPAPPRAKYLEPTAPPRADRRGTVDGSAGRTVAVVEPTEDTEADSPASARRVSTVVSAAPTIITRRVPSTPPPATMPPLWSLAATLVAVAGVVTGVVWFVQKNQAAPATLDESRGVDTKLHAARTATLAAPAPSAGPVRIRNPASVPTPASISNATAPGAQGNVNADDGKEPPAQAESVELEALPVLPSLQVDPARVRLEQAREATKRELAAQETPETGRAKAVPAPKPVSVPAPAPAPASTPKL